MILDHHVSIIIPSTVDVDKPAGDLAEKLALAALEKFARLFGGASRTNGQGAWISEDKGLVVEDNTIITSYCDKHDLMRQLSDVLAFAQLVCKQMGQECVAVQVDDSMCFVDATTYPAVLQKLAA